MHTLKKISGSFISNFIYALVLTLGVVVVVFFPTYAEGGTKDSTNIKIRVMHQPGIQISGDAFNDETRKLQVSKLITASNLEIGSFGIHSGQTINCEIGFKSANNFELRHSDDKRDVLVGYTVKLNDKSVNTSRSLANDCQQPYQKVSLLPANPVNLNNKNGYYSDTLSVIVSVQ